MRLKEKNLLKKFAATLKKFSAQGAKKVEYGMWDFRAEGLEEGKCFWHDMVAVNKT